uniref:Uncharacterized protein n=1 Tax=Cannabis sativa TaxID=3483 RepID=A0A803Q789_CANSA
MLLRGIGIVEHHSRAVKRAWASAKIGVEALHVHLERPAILWLRPLTIEAPKPNSKSLELKVASTFSLKPEVVATGQGRVWVGVSKVIDRIDCENSRVVLTPYETVTLGRIDRNLKDFLDLGDGFPVSHIPNESMIKKLRPPEKAFLCLRRAMANRSIEKVIVFEIFGLDKGVKERRRVILDSPSLLGNQRLVMMNERSKTKATKKFGSADSRPTLPVNFTVVPERAPPELRNEALDRVTSGFKDLKT